MLNNYGGWDFGRNDNKREEHCIALKLSVSLLPVKRILTFSYATKTLTEMKNYRNAFLLSAVFAISTATNSQCHIELSTTQSTIEVGSFATITASGAANYVWTPNVGLNVNTGGTVMASPTITTTYTVTGTCAWLELAGGTVHSLGIKTDGSLWGWGSGAYGQLGIGLRRPTRCLSKLAQIPIGLKLQLVIFTVWV